MRPYRWFLHGVITLAPLVTSAQERSRLPDVSMTFKGDLVLPVSFNNPIFNSVTENIGQLGGTFQVPVYKGLGLGVGGNMTWYSIKERALSPVIISGDVQRIVGYGKLQYEQYTGDRTFYELNARVGAAKFNFNCATCPSDGTTSFYWALGTGFFIHATDNLAFGLTVAYDALNRRFAAADLGLDNFPGRLEVEDQHDLRNLAFGLSFSTRFRRSERDVMSW